LVAKSTGKKAVLKRSVTEKPKAKAVVVTRKIEEPAVKTEKRPPLPAPKKVVRVVEAPAVTMPVPMPVPTDGKPRKNQAGLTSKELEFYRDLILAKRREIVGDMSSMEREALRTSGTNLSNLPLHMADMGTDNYEQEFTLGLVEKDRKLLRDLNDALAKIQNGTYGICEGTGKPISKARLEAQPWARFSIEHARKLEGRLR
jgi:DnaK suppressor protein